MVETPVNLENEKKKNIRLAVGVASLGVIGFFCIYIVFFAIMFFSPFKVFQLFSSSFPSFSEDVIGLDDKLLIFSKSFDFEGATYEKPPKEKMTMRIYNGKSLSNPEEIKPFTSLYPAGNKIYFFDRGTYRTYDMKTWEEFKNAEIGANSKGAVGVDGIWVLSTIRKKPVLRLITETGTKDVALPDDIIEKEIRVCSSQLICHENNLHVFWRDGGTLVWHRYDGKKWEELEMLEESEEYKVILLNNKISLLNLRHFGNHLEIALREYNGFFWSEPKTFNIRGISFRTIPAVFKNRLIFFQQGFFSEKYYSMSGEKIEGPYTISKPFFYSVNLWKVLFISFSSWIIFFLFIFLLSLLIRKYKLKTWKIDSKEFEFASLFRRGLAWSIDFLIITIPAVTPFYFVLKDGFFPENPFQYFALFFYSLTVMFLGNFLYHSLSEGLWGKTVGKKICGIVVLKEDFSKCTVGRGFLRNLMWVVDGFFYYLVAAVAMAGTVKWQRLGDLVAGTVVVRDKNDK
jgi:uncharacterized RDD family membrane protein YckC